MATWGVKIYEDDVALDVRELFLAGLKKNKEVSTVEATVRHECILPDDDFGNEVVLLALCSVEIETGTLSDDTKEAALSIIEGDVHIQTWCDTTGDEDAQKRKEVLDDLKTVIMKYDDSPVDISEMCGLDTDGENTHPSNSSFRKYIRTAASILGYVSLALLVSYICYALVM